jgi:GTPase SAR1 family protein
MSTQHHYISCQRTEVFLDTFASALDHPETHPVLFSAWGIGGVGKSTLLQKIKDVYHSEAQVVMVTFGLTEGTNTPIKLMQKLHSELEDELPSSLLTKRENKITRKQRQESEPFTVLCSRYFDIAHRLKTQSIDKFS